MSNKRISWFWLIQSIAWVVVGIINFIPQHIVSGKTAFVQYLNLLMLSVGGFAVTSTYRAILKKSKYQFPLKADKIATLLSISTIVESVCWLLLIVAVTLPIAGSHNISMRWIAFQIIPLGALILIWNLVYLTYHIIRQYHITEVEKWKLEAEIEKANLGTLRSQINPHFMFNALNNIRALILEDPNKAREMLTLFSETFRYALQHSENSETTVAKEVSIVKQYLQLVGIQYEDKMTYTVDVEDATLQATIPPMILQLLVENAVKHGIALSPTGGIIAIDIRQSGKRLIMKVKNTGTLQQKNQLESSIGIGLNNVTRRLRLMYKDNADVRIEEQPPFVCVTISIDQL